MRSSGDSSSGLWSGTYAWRRVATSSPGGHGDAVQQQLSCRRAGFALVLPTGPTIVLGQLHKQTASCGTGGFEERTLSSCVGGVSGLFRVAAAPPSRLNRPPNSGSAYAVLGLAKATATASASAPSQDARVFCHWSRGSTASCIREIAYRSGASVTRRMIRRAVCVLVCTLARQSASADQTAVKAAQLCS